ncbi:MAG TPA: TonB-dependent receptor [Bacteroidia bacterium]|jgi:outer membrane receptor for ferrienterochelin and colicins|nr:TonB-dependent receptor [Bacteroidia bacterium]
MKKLFFSLIGICFCTISIAQLKGRVVELDANKKTSGLPNVVIQVKHGEFTVSDTSGNFIFNQVKKGDTLIFSLTGYKTEGVILKDISKPISVVLSSGINLNAVEIEYRSSGTELSYLSAMKIETLGERSLMKAACCNLSESFETNPSIDVNFADAVSGTKQIQMLGLSGQYAQITKENMPYMRGLANGYGLTFIPGTWIKSIQLSKGAGSVVNGYESFTGQINTELHDPMTQDKFTFNTYVNQNGRNEYNLNFKQAVTKHFSTNWLAHTSFNPLAQDMNKDGFIDIPTGRQYNIAKKYTYEGKKGFEARWGATYLKDERKGGQITLPNNSDTLVPYKIGINNEKWEMYSKTGFVFRNKPGTSMGLQLSYLNHQQDNFFGNNIYKALQKTLYANYIFQGILKTTDNTYKIGASYMDDDVNEKFQLYKFNRREQVAGGFAELAINRKDKFNLVAGLRADYHNYYGLFYTPRLHMRFAFTQNSILRLSGGRALRTANIFADNSYLMASSRQWILEPSDLAMPYGLKPETGWNYGLNFTQKFKINYRDAYITIDAYRTDFTNQVVMDLDNNAQQVLIYNLKGPSYSNTAQFEFNTEPRKRLFIKTAYRYVDTKVTYHQGLLQKPMVSAHRAFINFSYETRNEHWQFDFTTQYNGAKRLPNTQTNPSQYQRSNYSPEFFNLLGQITYLIKIKRAEFNFYVGVENLLNYKQTNPIVASDLPYSKYFDASMVWGPIYGRMLYAGLRFKIKELTWLKFKEDN